jgi:hypothetical protein
VPYVVDQWRRQHPGHDIEDGQVFVQPWPASAADKRRDQVIYYQYRHDRARRTLHGIDEQVAKAEKAVAGKIAVKRNRFVQLTGATKSVNRALEAKARALAGLKGYVTNLAACPDGTPVSAAFVIDAYHRLIEIEKSFRMSKHDLAARPIYHHKRDPIEAHLTIVFAALAISRFIEDRTGWSIRKFVRTARRYRTHPNPGRRPPPSPPPTHHPTTCATPSISSTRQCALNEPTRVDAWPTRRIGEDTTQHARLMRRRLQDLTGAEIQATVKTAMVRTAGRFRFIDDADLTTL